MKNCKCYEEIRSKLQSEGLAISDKCKALRVVDLDRKLSTHIGFPLQATDGKKPKRGKPTFMFLTHCPFCGEKYGKPERAVAAR